MSQRARILWVIVLAIAPLVVLSGVGLWQQVNVQGIDAALAHLSRGVSDLHLKLRRGASGELQRDVAAIREARLRYGGGRPKYRRRQVGLRRTAPPSCGAPGLRHMPSCRVKALPHIRR